ncbi:MAG TPA: D-aminoacylase [Myxococcaceae bacterium]|nr:D-aminoacylase [Myxococcaceae bacterium]
MRRSLLAVACVLGACAGRGQSAEPFDLVLEHGEVIDGTGAPRLRADVGVRGDRLAAVGDLTGAPSRRRIDVTGRVVTPGFIDLLDQSAFSVLIDPRAEAKIRQGITTALDGEGESVAPVDPGALEEWHEAFQRYHLTVDWTTLDGYWTRLRRTPPAIRVATLVGAKSVRATVLGRGNVQPSAEQLQRMRAEVESGMRQGAFGVGSALPYPVSRHATTDELLALAEVAGRSGGFYATHVRNEDDDVVAAVDEAIEIGRRAHVPVEIWHLKVWGQRNWGRMKEVVAHIERARAAGLDVSANVYPYLVAANRLSSDLPGWASDGGLEATLSRLRDPVQRRRAEQDIQARWIRGEPERIRIGGSDTGRIDAFTGKTLAAVARELGMTPAAALVEIVLRDRASTSVLREFGSEEDLRLALEQPWTAVGVDAGAGAVDGPLATGFDHPRGFGTTARILGRYVRQQRLLTLEEAVRKMTSLPAHRLGLPDLGVVRPGALADLVVFDPATVIDTATFEVPRAYPLGFDLVVVGGQVVLEHGVRTDARPGGPLLHAGRRPGPPGGELPPRASLGGATAGIRAILRPDPEGP